MSCSGSSSATSYGPADQLGQLFNCGTGQVLVGVDLAYTPPVESAGYRSGPGPGAFDHPDAFYGDGFDAPPLACTSNAGCSAPQPYCVDGTCVECRTSGDCDAGQVCTDGTCVTPPPVWTPGAVNGITAYYCASADSVFAGSGAAPRRAPTGIALPGNPKAATFLCPTSQALTGATAWVNPAGDTEQIRLQCTQFAAGTPAGASSPPYPSTRMPKSLATPTTLSTLGTPPAALFVNALAQGWAASQGDPISALAFGCTDYQDEFDSSSARRFACCTGTAANPQFCQGYAAQTSACDSFMTQFCETDCSPAGGCLHTQCGCLGSPVGQPECYDSRCADTPRAYMTAQMVTQKPSCPTTVSCPIWQALGNGQFLAKEITPPVGCLPPPGPTISPAAIIAFIVVVIFLIFLAGVVGSSASAKKAPIFAPPPPPDIFT